MWSRSRHGRPHRTTFYPPGTQLGPADGALFEGTDETHYEYPVESRWGTLVSSAPSAAGISEYGTRRRYAPESSLRVEVSGFADPWEEQIDLIESESDATHFIVETDEYGLSSVRFGNNVNGRALPQNAAVTCSYQIGRRQPGEYRP